MHMISHRESSLYNGAAVLAALWSVAFAASMRSSFVNVGIAVLIIPDGSQR